MNGTERLYIRELAFKWAITREHSERNVVSFDTKEEAEKVLNSWRYADDMRVALESLYNAIDCAIELTPELMQKTKSILEKVK